MTQALDEALRLYVVNQFGSWMKDPTDQPARARNGIEKAVKAWKQATEAIDDWEV
jgi:hypothetical protein